MTPQEFLIRNHSKRLLGNGIALLNRIPVESLALCFFDPQYREILEFMNYGNEGSRQKERAALAQMDERMIFSFLVHIADALQPGGYLFFWVDKFMLGEGVHKTYIEGVNHGLPANKHLHLVDYIIWDKVNIGQGYRSRRRFEPMLIIQKSPKGIKSWMDRGIPDVWAEKIEKPRSHHPHKKPVGLIERLILSVTKPDDFIGDPCAGEFGVLDVCQKTGRRFIGCDLSPKYGVEAWIDPKTA